MRKQILTLALLASCSVAVADNWMKRLPDDAYVSQVTIPGAHDAATGCGWDGGWDELADRYARTQDVDMATLWHLGIRAFDLRPCVFEEYLNLNHGLMPTKMHFDAALRLLCDSLRANPSEFVVIHMLHASDGDQVEEDVYDERIQQELQREEYQPYLVDFKADLTVADMRGKMLIISRDKYAASPVTGGFFDAWTGEINWSKQLAARILGPEKASAKLCVQDFSDTHRQGDVERKVQAIRRMLDFTTQRATNSAADIRWAFNLASAYSKVESIFGNDVSLSDGYRDNAVHTHAAILDYLSSSQGGPAGIILMDYAGVDQSGDYQVRGRELIDSLIAFNFRYLEEQQEPVVQEPPPMGWSSWNTYGVNINENLIKRQTDAMVQKGLKNVGYDHINIDDGYFGGRDSKTGQLLIHPTRFPNGLKGIVDYIHQKGLKAGIYSDAGRNTCGSMFSGDPIGKGVGLYQHDQQDADYFFLELGFDFIKVDFCGGSYYHNEDHLVLDEQERYTAIAQAIRNTGRTDVRMNACRWAYPGTWINAQAASWRTTGDINASWGSVRDILAENLYMSAYCYDGHYNDMDMLEVGRSLTAEEDKTHFGMWCIMASPLLIGCDMTNINGTALNLLKNKELIALNQDSLHLQAYLAKKQDGCFLMVKDIETLQGTRRAFAVYNPEDEAKTVSVSFRDIDLGGSVKLRDVFQKKNLGTFTDTYSVAVPAHGTRIYVAEGELRLERTRYEAETAFISDYQEIKNNQSEKTGIYEAAAYCSGGYKAGWLGQSEQNDLQWRDVYSAEGGDYQLSVGYISGESRTFIVSVNGQRVQSFSANSGGWDRVGRKTLTVQLQKGRNVIRLSNPNGWMPDIDYIELISREQLGIDTNLKSQTSNLKSSYDLLGRPVDSAQAHGIVITEGRKTLR